LIRDNPFRLLGLPATASDREVRRRFEEIAVKSSLGLDAGGLESDSLTRIRHALDDPVTRFTNELFWLHSADALVGPELDPHVGDGTSSSVMEGLRSAAGRPPSLEQALALHDLAVFSYAAYERADEASDPSAPLSLWADVFTSEQFWSYLQERATAADDARLTPQVVERTRNGLPGEVLALVAARAATLVHAQRFEDAAALLRAIRRSGFPRATVQAAAETAISPLRVRLREGTAAVDEAISALPKTKRPFLQTRTLLEQAETLLVVSVLDPISRLKMIDPVFDDAELADDAASTVRRLGVAICNVEDDWGWASLLLRQALETARTPSFVAQLAREQAQVRADYHHTIATEAAHRGEALLSAAHIELALPYARDVEEREDWMNVAIGARQSGRLTDKEVEGKKSAISTELRQREEAFRKRIREAAERPEAMEQAAVEQESASAEPTRRKRWWRRGGD
jgi:hypothetical protein